jgi:hypothetical protein
MASNAIHDPRTSVDERPIRAMIDGKIVAFSTIEEKFEALAGKWKSEKGPQSSITRLSMHPAYQQIIGMGDLALPLIFHELRARTDHWFWALNAITGADPVPESSRGIMSDMTSAWLNWGKVHGYCQGD